MALFFASTRFKLAIFISVLIFLAAVFVCAAMLIKPGVENVEETISKLEGTEYQNYFYKKIDHFYKKEGINGMVKRVISAFKGGQIGMFECHSLAHDIGHYAGYPDNFGDIENNISKENLDFCGSGFLHGVEGQLANEAYPENALKLYYFCGLVKPHHPYYEGCYHGAGHAFMENAHDVALALEECDKLKTGENTPTVVDCYRGVFSENADAVAQRKEPPSALLSFCSSLEEPLQAYCAMELNGFQIVPESSAEDIEKSFAICVEGNYADVIKEGCIRSLSWVATDALLSKSDYLTPSPFVQTLPSNLKAVYIDATYGSFRKTAAYKESLVFNDFCEQFNHAEDVQYCKESPVRLKEQL